MPRFGLLLVVVSLVTCTGLVAFGVRSLVSSRKADVILAEVRTRNLAQSIDQNISGTLKIIDIVLQSVVNEVEREQANGGLSLPRLRNFTESEGKLIPEAMLIRVIDDQGRVLVGNSRVKPQKGFSAFYSSRRMQDHSRVEPYISRPMLDPLTNKWVIICERRYGTPDSSFGGVVAIPVSLDHFQKLLQGFEVGVGGTLTLRDIELGFMTRSPIVLKGQTINIGEKIVSPELREIARFGTSQATYFTRTPFDQTLRTFTVRKLQNAPLIVLAGLAEDDYLSQWRQDRNVTIIVMAAFVLAIGITFLVIWHFWRKHESTVFALHENERRASGLLEAIPDLMLHLNRAGAILDFKAEVGNDTGSIPRDRFGEYLLEDLTSEQTVLIKRKITETLARDSLQTFDFQRIGKDGTHWHFEARMVPSGPDEVMAIVRDTTDRVQAEETRQHLQAKLHQAQKMENLGNLAGGVAHDMNNVLGAILALASANVETQEQGSSSLHAFQTIIRAAERGGKMVKGLLTFSRQTPAEIKGVNVNTLLIEEAHLLERTTMSKIRIELDLTPEIRPISGDASALSHLIMNLCVNAVDAMREGGTLTLRTRVSDQTWIEVLVEDTGTGMPKAVLEKALDPFFTTKDVGKGTGLGLAIVYRTVMAHKGKIDIQSEPGIGTKVNIRFPCSEVGAKEETFDPEPQFTPKVKALEVLLIDDDELIQSSMVEVLDMLGHHATTVSSGEDALAMLETGFRPEVVILDMNMPGLGGLGTLPRLRKLLPTVPVLLCTGRADDTALDLMIAHADVTLLPKPFTTKELQMRLGQVIQC